MRNIALLLSLGTIVPIAGCAPAGSVSEPKASAPATWPAEEPAAKLAERAPAPLLLDDAPVAPARPEGSADNTRCEVCHLNLAQEDLAVTHARAGVGCAGCHGQSDAHIADESWASGGNGTAPERMFPRPSIDAFCMGCHPKDKLLDVEDHKPALAEGAEAKVCVDCHGKHRIPLRRCRWK